MRRALALRNRHRIVAHRRVLSAVDRAVDDLVGRQREAHGVEPAQHGVIVPGGLRAQVADAVAARPGAERIEQLRSDAMALRVAAHADRLEPQPGLAAAELASEHARQDVAGETVGVGRRELRVQLRGPQRGREPPLEVGAPRPALDRGVDADDGVQILARQRAHVDGGIDGSSHGVLSLARCFGDDAMPGGCPNAAERALVALCSAA